MPLSSPTARPAHARHGFTLVELLTVISIMAILAGILVPVVGVVQRKAKEGRTKVLFQKFIGAFDGYKLEYGRYPISIPELAATATPWISDKNEVDYAFLINDGNAILRKVLTADRDYMNAAKQPGATNYNRLGIRFLELPDDMITREGDGTLENPFIVDGFGNYRIGVVVHSGNSQEIDKDAFAATKPVTDLEETVTMQPKVVRNIPLSIAMYSLVQPINNDPVNSRWTTNWPYDEFNQ